MPDIDGIKVNLTEKVSDVGIEKAGDVVDAKTGDKFDDKVDMAQKMADGKIGQ